MLKSFLKIMKEQDVDIVIGSKLHKDSKLDYPLIRKIMSYGYYLMLKVLLIPPATPLTLRFLPRQIKRASVLPRLPSP